MKAVNPMAIPFIHGISGPLVFTVSQSVSYRNNKTPCLRLEWDGGKCLGECYDGKTLHLVDKLDYRTQASVIQAFGDYVSRKNKEQE